MEAGIRGGDHEKPWRKLISDIEKFSGYSARVQESIFRYGPELQEGAPAGQQKEVAEATGIPETHLSDMKLGRRRCTPEYDLRLSKFFGTSEGRWLRLQMAYDLDKAAAYFKKGMATFSRL